MSMDLTPQFALNIEQGVNFEHTFQWFSGGVFMAPIEFIQVGYPTIVTVTNHGLNTLTPHPVIISGVQGCDFLNSDDTGIALCRYIDANTFELPQTSVNSIWEQGSGEITYLKLTDLTDATARCVIRKNWFASTAIHEMTTENGGITLGVVDASIQLSIPKATTAAFTFNNAVYDVDITIAGFETRVFKGPVYNHYEVSP